MGIEFTMQVGCSVGCEFCPQSTFVKNYKSHIKRFTLENFEKALKNIENSTIKVIKFSGFSEPLENSAIYDCIILAHKKGYNVELITTLKNFSKDSFEKIKDLPIKCHISIQPPFANNRKGLSDAEAWGNFEQLLSLKPTCELVIGCLDYNLSLEQKKALKAIENKFNITITYEKYTTRSGYLSKTDFTYKHKKLVCKHNMGAIVLPNGDLALCCMDFGLKHIIGNIFEQHYNDILNGSALRDILDIMLGKKDGDILCHSCEYAKVVPNFVSVRSYLQVRKSLQHLRDTLLPKHSILRKKLNSIFR